MVSKETFVLYQQHMANIEPENLYTAKHHIMFHLLQKQHDFGNPRNHATWKSEAMNKVLKKACRDVSQATFDLSILLKMQDLLAWRPKRPFA